MKYLIWIGLGMALLAVLTVRDPLWWTLLGIGIGANGLVCAANDWKMPVRGRHAEGPRHTPMTQFTRYKWLGDVIPTGFGKASVGDFFICAGFLGSWVHLTDVTYVATVVIGGYLIWTFGWSQGFGLRDKLDTSAVADTKKNIPIMVTLMLVGNLIGFHGCSVKEIAASFENIRDVLPAPKVSSVPLSEMHSLGKLVEPEFITQTRQKAETGKQAVERSIAAALDRFKPLTITSASGQTVTVAFTLTGTRTMKAARSGPFCRMTCTAHHGGMYDVETLPEACRANWIPPTAEYVPGWYSMSDTMEITNPWPGPAQKGFESYKLYWSDRQSEAKVLHPGTTENQKGN